MCRLSLAPQAPEPDVLREQLGERLGSDQLPVRWSRALRVESNECLEGTILDSDLWSYVVSMFPLQEYRARLTQYEGDGALLSAHPFSVFHPQPRYVRNAGHIPRHSARGVVLQANHYPCVLVYTVIIDLFPIPVQHVHCLIELVRSIDDEYQTIVLAADVEIDLPQSPRRS